MTNFFAKNEKKIGCDLRIPKNNRNFAPQNRGVAQLVVYLVWDQVVARSSRVTPTLCEECNKNCCTLFLFTKVCLFRINKDDNSLIVKLLSSSCDSGGYFTRNG